MTRGRTQKEKMHPAWVILFQQSDFMRWLGKPGINLRAVCSEFRSDFPSDVFIHVVFDGVRIRKVDVFRLLPLSVNDVIRLRSPLLFSDAFAIAVRRSGGFEQCMNIVREKGWHLSCGVGRRREIVRKRLGAQFSDAGLPTPPAGELFDAVITGRRVAERAAIWRICLLHAMPSTRHQCSEEYDAIMWALKHAVGFWYGGVNRDARLVEERIREARTRTIQGDVVAEMHHQSISCKVFLYGVVRFE